MSTNPYHIAELISKYLSGTITAQEEKLLEHWIAESEENSAMFEALKSDEQSQADMEFFARLDIEGAWGKITNHPTNESIFLKIVSHWKSIAVAVVAFTLAWVWWPYLGAHADRVAAIVPHAQGDDVMPGGQKAVLVLSDGSTVDLTAGPDAVKEQDGTTITSAGGELTYANQHKGKANGELLYNVLEVPKAGMYNLTLSDGTRVWVNAMSQLRFPTRFGKKNRKVFLKGEAYFEVASEASRPFVVEVDGVEVEVLGTHFNINSYQDVTTTVVEGSVRVKHDDASAVLKPGLQARITERISVYNADMRKVIAWKNGDFYFRSDRIVDIMEQLARWYDLSIVYEGNVPYNRGYNGSISRNVKLSDVLEILGFVTKATFTVEEREVTVQF